MVFSSPLTTRRNKSAIKAYSTRIIFYYTYLPATLIIHWYPFSASESYLPALRWNESVQYRATHHTYCPTFLGLVYGTYSVLSLTAMVVAKKMSCHNWQIHGHWLCWLGGSMATGRLFKWLILMQWACCQKQVVLSMVWSALAADVSKIPVHVSTVL
jgi:hypothetical protein